MNAFLTSLTALAEALLKTSLQAALVIALVLAVQWLGRKHLSPRVRYALWLLVALRLALPISLESSVSVFNWATTAAAGIARAANPPPTSPTVTETNPVAAPRPRKVVAQNTVPNSPLATEPPSSQTAPPIQRTTNHASPKAGPPAFPPWPWPLILSLVWLAGVVFLLGRIIWIPLRLNARLARQETATPPAVFEILEQAKRLIGVNQVLPIVQSRAVESPALLGFIRPWLLLPHGLVEKFTADELRLVFLHELAHLKRRDIALNWLMTLLQVLHWFNPLVWYAFARMRADREEACDELALAHARAEENRAYGHAIIKLLEGFSRPPALPGLVGILEDKQHMQRRITMIAQFKRMIPWSAPAAGLFLVLGIVTLTDAQTERTASARIFGPNSGPTVRIVLSGLSNDAYGVLAPDESAVAYTDWGAEGGELAARNLHTGESKTLVVAPQKKNSYTFTVSQAWSADSRWIAYDWLDEDNHCSVRIISRDGGAPKVISDKAFFPFDWSSNGKLLVGELSHYYRKRLAILDVATGDMREIGARARHARFSPDGKFIVCERMVNGSRHVVLLNADGTAETRISTEQAEGTTPIFSKDGGLILFSSNQRGTWDLWAAGVESAKIAGVAQLIRYDFGDHPKWLTTSGRLAFRMSGGGDQSRAYNIYEIAGTVPSANQAGSGPRLLSKTSSGRNVSPAYSPDGKLIAYVRPRHSSMGYPALCVQSLTNEVERVYEPHMKQIGRLFWSPDSQTIAMTGTPEDADEAGIYFFSVATRALSADRLKRSGWYEPLGFSADGKEFVFFDQKINQRVAMAIATKVTRQIPSPAEFMKIVASLQWERPMIWDETSLVYVKGARGSDQELIVAGSDGGNAQVIARTKAPDSIERAVLSPDRAKMAYSVWKGSAEQTKLHVRAMNGSWDYVADTGSKSVTNTGFNWSGDSSKLVVTLTEKLPGEIAVLENFLPPEKLAAK